MIDQRLIEQNPLMEMKTCESIKDLIYHIIIFLILHMIAVFADFL
jgi:hypothetical protein